MITKHFITLEWMFRANRSTGSNLCDDAEPKRAGGHTWVRSSCVSVPARRSCSKIAGELNLDLCRAGREEMGLIVHRLPSRNSGLFWSFHIYVPGRFNFHRRLSTTPLKDWSRRVAPAVLGALRGPDHGGLRPTGDPVD